jgi:hypothetical protein
MALAANKNSQQGGVVYIKKFVFAKQPQCCEKQKQNIGL